MDQFLGFVALGDTLRAGIVTRDENDIPKDATAAPGYRVYGPDGLMTNGTGSLAAKDSGTVTGATTASPVVVHSVAHGLTTGTRVTVANVGGMGGVNGDRNVTVVDADHFSLDGTSGSGTYTSGGTWHVAGLYNFAVTPQGADGYESGRGYDVLVSYVVSGVSKAALCRFQVV